MLNGASDYKFVKTSQIASKIHGNILPRRTPTAATSPVYFEDYLFQLEAYYERMNPESAGSNSVVADITLNARNIYDLKINSQSLSTSNSTMRGPNIGYDNDATYYISPDTTYPNNHVNTGYTEDSTYYIYSYLQNWMNPSPEMKSPYYGMQPYYGNNRLLSEFIRMRFWGYNRMSKMLIPLRGGSFATKILHQTLKPDGSVDSEYEEGLRNSTFSYLRGYSTTTDNNGNRIEYQVFKTIVTYRDSFFTFPYATNADLIWKCSVSKMGGDSQENTKYVWGTKHLSITNGALVVPTDMLETMFDEACDISGRPLNSTISLYNCYLVVDFEFPARLNGVDWNWNPQYTS